MSMRSRIPLAVLIACSGQLPISGAGVPQGVLLITVDSLRADYLGCNGSTRVETPNIDRLASEGVNFTRVRSSVPLTLPAHASIHTGSYPPTHGVRSNLTRSLPRDALTLAEILEPTGYRSIAAVSSFLLARRFGLDQGFEVYDDRVWQEIEQQERVTGERSAGQTLLAFRTWLGLVDGHQRFFFWLHFNDPHFPYDPPEPFSSRHADDLYAGEVAYVDAVIGEVVKELEKRGRSESTLIVVVGDHGEGLGDHGERFHALTIFNEQLHVPLVMRSKGQIAPGTVVENLVRTIDLAPTVLDLLGIDRRLGEGVSLVRFLAPAASDSAAEGRVATERAASDLDAYSESRFGARRLGWAPAFGLERGDYRLIQSAEPELFRIADDPAELRNLVDDRAEMVAELQNRLREFGSSEEPLSVPPNMAVWSQIEVGIEALRLGKARDALEVLRPILEQHPSIPLLYELIGRAWLSDSEVTKAQGIFLLALEREIETGVIRRELGKIYLEGDDLDRAELHLRRAVELDVLDARADLYLADFLRLAGEHAEAMGHYRQAITLNTTYFPAWMGLARTLADSGRPEEAISAYRRAQDIDPDNLTIRTAIEEIKKSSRPETIEIDR